MKKKMKKVKMKKMKEKKPPETPGPTSLLAQGQLPHFFGLGHSQGALQTSSPGWGGGMAPLLN